METSCGVVLVNFGQILLLQYPQGHWDFPKGHVEESDQNRIQTARRELQEETGISEIEFVEGFEDRTSYAFHHKGKKIEKQVFWYVALTDELDVHLSSEHLQHIWLDWDAAEDLMSHEESRTVLLAAREFLRRKGIE